jgi:hypothetical protein
MVGLLLWEVIYRTLEAVMGRSEEKMLFSSSGAEGETLW